MSDEKLRLGFAGTPELAATVLQALIENTFHNITYIYTQPDRPSGRGRILTKSAVKQLAEVNNLVVRQPETPADFNTTSDLSKVDALIVAAYGLLLPVDILNSPRLGCINVHTSLLPRWRGAAPIQRAIQAGDKKTGITIMQMDAGLDTGDILLQQSCPIHSYDTAGSLHDRLATLAANCLLETLDGLIKDTITPYKQDNKQATYANKITKADALIDWTKSAVELERMIRAFIPAPVAHTELNGIKMRLWETGVLDDSYAKDSPGTIVACNSEGIIVITGEQLLSIRKLQLPGKKITSAQDFLNGYPDFMNARDCTQS